MFDVIRESLLLKHNTISSELQVRSNPANLYDTSLGKLTSDLIEVRHALLWRKEHPTEDLTKSPYSKMLWSFLQDYEIEQEYEWAELDKLEPKSEAEEERISSQKKEIEKRLTLVKNLKIQH